MELARTVFKLWCQTCGHPVLPGKGNIAEPSTPVLFRRFSRFPILAAWDEFFIVMQHIHTFCAQCSPMCQYAESCWFLSCPSNTMTYIVTSEILWVASCLLFVQGSCGEWCSTAACVENWGWWKHLQNKKRNILWYLDCRISSFSKCLTLYPSQLELWTK